MKKLNIRYTYIQFLLAECSFFNSFDWQKQLNSAVFSC